MINEIIERCKKHKKKLIGSNVDFENTCFGVKMSGWIQVENDPLSPFMLISIVQREEINHNVLCDA